MTVMVKALLAFGKLGGELRHKAYEGPDVDPKRGFLWIVAMMIAAGAMGAVWVHNSANRSFKQVTLNTPTAQQIDELFAQQSNKTIQALSCRCKETTAVKVYQRHTPTEPRLPGPKKSRASLWLSRCMMQCAFGRPTPICNGVSLSPWTPGHVTVTAMSPGRARMTMGMQWIPGAELS